MARLAWNDRVWAFGFPVIFARSLQVTGVKDFDICRKISKRVIRAPDAVCLRRNWSVAFVTASKFKMHFGVQKLKMLYVPHIPSLTFQINSDRLTTIGRARLRFLAVAFSRSISLKV